jgi:hypothetical protein
MGETLCNSCSAYNQDLRNWLRVLMGLVILQSKRPCKNNQLHKSCDE